MASKKDLIEAYAYNRRRMVTAFVSGAPGGREVEPTRPGRAIIAGIVLAALVVAGGAMAGVIKPTVKSGWDDNSLVVARKTGARYLAQGGNLFPVRNTASARLLIAAGQFKVVFAPEDRIAKARQGPLIGIEDAPDAIPLARDLIQSGWTACAMDLTAGDAVNPDGGLSLRLGRAPTAEPAVITEQGAVRNQGLVVQVGEAISLVSGRFRYAIDPAAVGTLLLALELTRPQVVDVPAQWLNLFTAGQPIKPMEVDGAGAAVPKAVGLPASVRRGQLVEIAGVQNLVVKDGIVPLSELQALMYRVGYGKPATGSNEGAEVAPLGTAPPNLAAATVDWPRDLPARYPLVDRTSACVILDASTTQGAKTFLARPITKAFLQPATPAAVKIDPAHGALITTGINEPTYLIDAAGTYYELGRSGEAEQLGYGAITPTFVPADWISVLRKGVALNRDVLAQQAEQPTTAAARP
ncbi:MAG: type VII secretion protein EccB [Sporichthyaceae bacterium]